MKPTNNTYLRFIVFALTGILSFGALGLIGTPKAMALDSSLIKITQFKVTHPDKNKVRVEIAAKATGKIKVGSYFLRFSQQFKKNAWVPEGFYRATSGYVYLKSKESKSKSPNILDDGNIDEDLQKGKWQVTINTSNWHQGRYYMLIGAHNRPAEGPYVSSSKTFKIVVGNPPPPKYIVSNAPDAKQTLIYKKKDVYAAFPTLTVLDPTTFVTKFATRTHASHIDPTGGSQTMITHDGGYTWKKTDEKYINPRWKTSWGALIDEGIRAWVYVPKSQYSKLKKQHRYIINAKPGVIAYLSPKAFYKVSKDNGKTWKKHSIKVPDYVSGLMNHHAHASKLVGENGLRLQAVYGKRIEEGISINNVKDEEFFLRSTDDGKTWEFIPMLPDGLGDLPVGFNETAIIQNDDGDIIAMMRSDPAGYLWKSISKDRGKTWSKPHKTKIWGYPADMIKLQDGRILCVYGYRKPPMGIRAVWSNDGGKTWDIKNEVIIRGDGFGSSSNLGYPLAAQLPNGTIFTIYYLQTRGGTMPFIAGTHWRLPDNLTDATN